jgi:cobalt-zinc-cadmium efflux system membrane fusion protein
MKYIILLMVVIMASCQTNHEEAHAHKPDGSHGGEGSDRPTVDYTVWTKKTELFVEFPVLIVGKTSRFTAHFTVLDKHQPLREGSMTVSMVKGGKGIRQTVDSPASEGIFKPTLKPNTAGIYQLIFEIETPILSDKIIIEGVQVFNSEEEVISAQREEGQVGAISFLKEQAWKMEFQTDAVSKEIIYGTIATAGVWKTPLSDSKILVATANGSVAFSANNLTVGSRVKEGQILLTISSSGLSENNLGTELVKAKAAYDQTKAEYERKKQLYESKIVAKAEFEKASLKYQVAQTNYQTLQADYLDDGKQILAPCNGFIKSVFIENGQYIEQGAPLFSIITDNASLLEIQVSSDYMVELADLKDVWYQAQKGIWSSLKQTGGKILSISKSVESSQPMLSVFSQSNEAISMPEGSFCEVQLTFGKGIESKVIPASALLEDYGDYSVIVQLSGESFERRPITIGARNGHKVEVLSGLEWGEVIVSKGAYQVKMASMSGQVSAHGHAH